MSIFYHHYKGTGQFDSGNYITWNLPAKVLKKCKTTLMFWRLKLKPSKVERN